MTSSLVVDKTKQVATLLLVQMETLNPTNADEILLKSRGAVALNFAFGKKGEVFTNRQTA